MKYLRYTVHSKADGDGFTVGAPFQTFVKGTPITQLPDWFVEKMSQNPIAFTEDLGPEVSVGAVLGVAIPPPMSGPGSSRDAWAAYARDRGIDVLDEDDVAKIHSMLRKRDVPVDPGHPYAYSVPA